MADEQDETGGTWTTEAFLAQCHADIRTIFAYWDGKRRGRPMPARRDLDPVLDIPRLLPNLMLVDVHRSPFRLTYRLVGTGEVEYRGGDPTGKDVAEHFFGRSRTITLFNYASVIERRAYLYRSDPTPTPDGWHVNSEIIFLPLSADGETVDMIMVYRVWQRQSPEERKCLPPCIPESDFFLRTHPSTGSGVRTQLIEDPAC